MNRTRHVRFLSMTFMLFHLWNIYELVLKNSASSICRARFSSPISGMRITYFIFCCRSKHLLLNSFLSSNYLTNHYPINCNLLITPFLPFYFFFYNRYRQLRITYCDSDYLVIVQSEFEMEIFHHYYPFYRKRKISGTFLPKAS